MKFRLLAAAALLSTSVHAARKAPAATESRAVSSGLCELPGYATTPAMFQTVVGQPPGFDLERAGADGRVSLSAFSGRVVLLDFWATWCPPCQISTPFLVRLQAEFPQLVIIGINQRQDEATVEAYMREHGVTYRQALDPAGDTARAYGVRGIPRFILIGPDGAIIYSHAGFDESVALELARAVRAALNAAAARGRT